MLKASTKDGKVSTRRKHPWLPCVLAGQINDGISEEEEVRIYQRTRFMDYVTDGE